MKAICFVCSMGRHGPVLFVFSFTMQALADQDDWTKLTTAHVFEIFHMYKEAVVVAATRHFTALSGSLNEKVLPSRCIEAALKWD